MELKNRILETAYNLISSCGITSVTMDIIAQNCGISKRTLYQIFPDKRTLILNAMENKYSERSELFKSILLSSSDTMTAMLKIFNILRELMNTVSPGFFLDMQRLYPDIAQQFNAMRDLHAKYFREIIIQGIEEGVFRKDIDVNIVSQLFFVQMQAIKTSPEFINNPTFGIAMHNACYIMYFRGISTPKGGEIINQFLSENPA